MLLLNFLGVISSCLLSVTEQNISIAKANEAMAIHCNNDIAFNHVMYEYGKYPQFKYEETLDFEREHNDCDLGGCILDMDTSGYTNDDGIYNHNLQDVSSAQLTQFPYSGVVQIVAGYDSNGDGNADLWGLGTGALVGPNILLTASHVVYSADYGWPISTTVYVETNGQPIASTSIDSAQVLAYNVGVFYNTHDHSDDWAYCKLNKNLGNTYGYFEVVNHSMAKQDNIKMIAYQKSFGYMTYASDKVRHTLTNYKFYHRIDALSGSSGAPIFYGNTDYIVGIHSAGIHNWLTDYNIACRISSYIESWIINARVDWAL